MTHRSGQRACLLAGPGSSLRVPGTLPGAQETGAKGCDCYQLRVSLLKPSRSAYGLYELLLRKLGALRVSAEPEASGFTFLGPLLTSGNSSPSTLYNL